jgi:hypothetical protein
MLLETFLKSIGFMKNFKIENISLQKIKIVNVFTILGILIFAMNLQNLVRNYFATYGTNDDYLMNVMLNGKYNGASTFHITYINEILGFILSEIYKVFPNLPIYGIFLLLMVTISLIGPILIQVKYNDNYSTQLIISWLVSSILITNWFVLNPTFTSTSMLISSFGYLIIYVLVNNRFSKKMYYFAILLLLLGYTLRVQGFQSSSLIWLPLILGSLGYQTFFKKIDYKIFVNLSTILASIAPIVLVIFINSNINSEWKDFYKFNKKLGSIVTTTRINYLEVNKTKLNISDELLTNLQNFALTDKRNFKIETLEDLITKSNSSQGVSGLINPVVDVKFRVESLDKYGGLVLLMLLLPIAATLINTRNRIYFFHLGLVSALILFSFYYVLSTAKIEERVIIPLALNLWFFAFAFLDEKKIKRGSKSLFLYLIFGMAFLSIFSRHVHHPTYFKDRSKWNQGAIEFAKQQKDILSGLGDKAIFVGPISAVRVNWTSPYDSSQTKELNFISLGWHSFSPTWYEKNQNIFKNEDSIFDNLINNKQTYWVSDAETAETLFSSNYWAKSSGINPKLVSSIESVENIYGGPYNVYSLDSK